MRKAIALSLNFQMYTLTEEMYEAEAKAKLRQVFAADHPYGETFESSVACRKVVYLCKSAIALAGWIET